MRARTRIILRNPTIIAAIALPACGGDLFGYPPTDTRMPVIRVLSVPSGFVAKGSELLVTLTVADETGLKASSSFIDEGFILVQAGEPDWRSSSVDTTLSEDRKSAIVTVMFQIPDRWPEQAATYAYALGLVENQPRLEDRAGNPARVASALAPITIKIDNLAPMISLISTSTQSIPLGKDFTLAVVVRDHSPLEGGFAPEAFTLSDSNGLTLISTQVNHDDRADHYRITFSAPSTTQPLTSYTLSLDPNKVLAHDTVSKKKAAFVSDPQIDLIFTPDSETDNTSPDNSKPDTSAPLIRVLSTSAGLVAAATPLLITLTVTDDRGLKTSPTFADNGFALYADPPKTSSPWLSTKVTTVFSDDNKSATIVVTFPLRSNWPAIVTSKTYALDLLDDKPVIRDLADNPASLEPDRPQIVVNVDNQAPIMILKPAPDQPLIASKPFKLNFFVHDDSPLEGAFDRQAFTLSASDGLIITSSEVGQGPSKNEYAITFLAPATTRYPETYTLSLNPSKTSLVDTVNKKKVTFLSDPKVELTIVSNSLVEDGKASASSGGWFSIQFPVDISDIYSGFDQRQDILDGLKHTAFGLVPEHFTRAQIVSEHTEVHNQESDNLTLTIKFSVPSLPDGTVTTKHYKVVIYSIYNQRFDDLVPVSNRELIERLPQDLKLEIKIDNKAPIINVISTLDSSMAVGASFALSVSVSDDSPLTETGFSDHAFVLTSTAGATLTSTLVIEDSQKTDTYVVHFAGLNTETEKTTYALSLAADAITPRDTISGKLAAFVFPPILELAFTAASANGAVGQGFELSTWKQSWHELARSVLAEKAFADNTVSADALDSPLEAYLV